MYNIFVKGKPLTHFEDEQDKMNLSVLDVGGEVCVVSQFTLYGDARKGRRPNFMKAAPPEIGRALIFGASRGFQRKRLNREYRSISSSYASSIGQ